MKKRYALLPLIIILGAVLFFFRTTTSASQPLVSPDAISGKLADNIWSPNNSSDNVSQGAPDITAKAAYFIDVDTGQVLYQKNIHDHLPIASLTKIMSVIVGLEHKNYNDVFTVSDHAAGMEPDHMELIAGEKLTFEELLDGVFLVSANDAAETIAENATGNRDEFIKLMNDKATFLGMKDSLFINPSGLEEDDKQQFSSAYDVALMSRYAIKKFPHLLDISSQPSIYLPQTETHQDYTLNTGINLLTTYPGVIGFKTGYTPEAGLTLVTVAKRDGHEVLGVILGSEDRRTEARELLNFSFQKLGVAPVKT